MTDPHLAPNSRFIFSEDEMHANVVRLVTKTYPKIFGASEDPKDAESFVRQSCQHRLTGGVAPGLRFILHSLEPLKYEWREYDWSNHDPFEVWP